MAEKLFVLDTEMTQVADKIREKTGATDLLSWPQGYINAVETMSGGLNFEVIGGATQPENPAENTVWVNTETDITKWTVSVSTPSDPVIGNVWIGIALTAEASVDVLDENDIILNLSESKQYDGNAWVGCDAKIYQNGEWTELDTTRHLIKDGKLVYEPLMTPNATFADSDSYVLFCGNNPGYWCGWFADVEIDGEYHSQFVIDGTFIAAGTDARFYFAVWENTVTPTKDNCLLSKNYSSGTAKYNVDISSLKGTYHVGLVSTYTYEQHITAMYLAR